MPGDRSKRALSRVWYVNSCGVCPAEKNIQADDPFRESTSWNKTCIQRRDRASYESPFVSSPASLVSFSRPLRPRFFRPASLPFAPYTDALLSLSLSLFSPYSYLIPVRSPPPLPDSPRRRPRELARLCANSTSTRCPLFPTVILFYENRRLLGRTEATTSLKVVAIDPPPFAIPSPLSVRFTLLPALCLRPSRVPRGFLLLPLRFCSSRLPFTSPSLRTSDVIGIDATEHRETGRNWFRCRRHSRG